MELLTKLGPIDLFIIILLALGIFSGFTAGLIRYALNIVVVIVAFIIASQLRVPLYNVLSFWQAFTPDLREQLLFLGLFLLLAISGWFMVRTFYKRTRLPIIRQLDEIGGAVLGLLFAALSIMFTMIVMDSFFKLAPDSSTGNAGPLAAFYNAMNSSVLVDFFRTTLIPTFGALARPFVPSEIAELLHKP
jgi:uncharacterized membrane protein required for colicin V production